MRWLWCLALTACVQSSSVTCSDGRICPADTVCRALTNPDATVCVTAQQVTACDGKSPDDSCTLDGVADARCYDGVCLEAGCGNGRIDAQEGEVCDDANAAVGDGCSYSCKSLEVCGNGLLDPIKLDSSNNPVPNEQCDDSNTLGHDGCAGTCQLETNVWQTLVASLPVSRESGGIAYDSARRRVVVFGGNKRPPTVTQLLADTWEFDGSGWLQIPTPTHPTARSHMMMAYDAKRRRTILFGGEAIDQFSIDSFPIGSSALGDTWEWDGVNWRQLAPASSPAPRTGAVGVYDGALGKIVMFGGQDEAGNALDETWTWDGVTWTELQPASKPPARTRHSLAYDPVRGKIVLVGGLDMQGVALTDTWELDGATWTNKTPTTGMIASGTGGIALAYDRVTSKVIAFGGASPGCNVNGDTWAWDGQHWAVLVAGSSSTPPPRTNAQLVADPVRGELVLVSGVTYTTPGNCPSTFYAGITDAWRWNGQTWTQITQVAPGARGHMASTYDPLRGRLIMFGGYSPQNAETWEFDGHHWENPMPSTAPSSRVDASMAFDAEHRVAVMFGGNDSTGGTGFKSDTWTWDGQSWTPQAPATVPPARSDAAMAYDPVRNKVVMFSGTPGTGLPVSDTWEWDGTNWTLATPATSPPPTYEGVAAWDPIARRIVLSVAETSTQWAWDGTTWMELATSTMPPPRQGPALAWDAPRKALVMHGGYGAGGTLDDSWELAGTTWTQEIPQDAPKQWAPAFVPRLDGTGLIAFGGFGVVDYLADLLTLRYVGATDYEACTLDVDDDHDGLTGCKDPDCWSYCTPLCPPGAACDTSWPHCGDGTCNAALESCRNCPGDCGTCTAACGDGFCDAPETTTTCPGDCTP